MMPVHLMVVRHGESVGNLAKRNSEQGDHTLLERLRMTHTAHWPLTKKGIAQAKKTGDFLREFSNTQKIYFDRMYVSTYARAMQTAAYLDIVRSSWSQDLRLVERDWGDLDRMTEDERAERFADSFTIRGIEPFFWAPLNGESFRDLIIRIRDFVDSMHRANAQNMLVVCHGEVMKAFRIILLGLTPSEYAEMEFSKDPLKRIHNCQVDHYTRQDPNFTTPELSKRLNWLQVYRPTETSIAVIPWKEIPSRRFASFELKQLANQMAAPFGDIAT
jgi:broad specificity phosphatase PhoE